MLLCNLHSIACKKTPRSPKPIPSFPPGERRFGDNQWTIKETSQKSEFVVVTYCTRQWHEIWDYNKEV